MASPIEKAKKASEAEHAAAASVEGTLATSKAAGSYVSPEARATQLSNRMKKKKLAVLKSSPTTQWPGPTEPS